MRFLFASKPGAIGPALGIVHRVIAGWLADQASVPREAAQCGAVTLIQRFGSALNLNIHFHMHWLDRVYEEHIEQPQRKPRLHRIRVPTSAQLTPSRRGKRSATDAAPADIDANADHRTPDEKRRAMTWAQRIKRVFGIDVSTCVHCGGAVRIVASIEEPTAILAHFEKHDAMEAAYYRPRPRGPLAVAMAA